MPATPAPAARDRRVLPTFLVAGAAKAGTTSLHDLLGQHPDVFVSPFKEPHFFAFQGRRPTMMLPSGRPAGINKLAITDPQAYRALFAGAGDAKAVGESSASSLYVEAAAGRIAAWNPDMKIVVSLREPVSRAYSSFNHARRYGIEDCTRLTDGFALEEGRIARDYPFLLRYRAMGLYAGQIERLYRHFPAENVLVVLFEDLRDRPHDTLARIFGFLGVDPGAEIDVGVHSNAGHVPDPNNRLHRLINDDGSVVKRVGRAVLPFQVRRRLLGSVRKQLFVAPPKLDPAERRALYAHFADDVVRLERLIGRDLSAWRPAPADGDRTPAPAAAEPPAAATAS